jgi:hypothetical protein
VSAENSRAAIDKFDRRLYSLGQSIIEHGRRPVAKRLPKILSLTAALSALSGAPAISPALANIADSGEADVTPQGRVNTGQANAFLTGGKDLLGLIVTTNKNGTIVAQHDSHYSHSSHASHSSHYSSN